MNIGKNINQSIGDIDMKTIEIKDSQLRMAVNLINSILINKTITSTWIEDAEEFIHKLSYNQSEKSIRQ